MKVLNMEERVEGRMRRGNLLNVEIGSGKEERKEKGIMKIGF